MNKNKGITLVALVVTIVVLLILAGVSINLVLGENGLINNAKEAKNKTLQAEKDDEESMDATANWIIQNVANLPQTTETKPYIPGSEFSQLEGTNLSNGLVIQDREGNQYVWIEVPMTEEVYPTTGLEITEFNADIYTKIEDDLHKYVKEYNKTKFSDEYCKDDTDGWFKNEEEYNMQKYKMLKSVYQNGGFWVGRYEAGIEKNRTKSGEATEIPQSKANLFPYNYVTRTQAKKLAEKVKYDEYSGSLMFGVQWDLMLKFIEVKMYTIDANIITKLNQDSTTIGNYINAEYTINRGKYTKYNFTSTWYDYGDELDGIVKNKVKMKQDAKDKGVLLTTGAADRNCLMNIYDVAGNIWEWTLEYSHIDGGTCADRGGSYYTTGKNNPANYHYANPVNYNYVSFGFRISIY